MEHTSLTEIGDFLDRSEEQLVAAPPPAAVFWFPDVVAPALFQLFAFGLAPSAAFYLLGHFIYMMHPLVNADYLALGIVAQFIPAWVTAALYFVLLINEIIVNIAPIYHFSVGEFILSLRYEHLLSPSFVVSVVCPALLVAGIGAYAASRLAHRGRPLLNASVLFVVAVVFCGMDIVNGTSFIPLPITHSFADINIAYSGVRRTVMSLQSDLRGSESVFVPLAPSGSATGELFQTLRSGGAPASGENVVVIVVESFGKWLNADAWQRMLAPFQQRALQNRYRVSFENVPFEGATIHGEFRELCGQKLAYFGQTVPSHCLPVLLKKAGYETFAFHGFTGQFYDRQEWYPKLQFDHIAFAEDLRRYGLENICGSGFEGICDLDIMDRLHQELLSAGPRPKFLYWMTLNSHLPIYSKAKPRTSLSCGENAAFESDPTLCLYAQLIEQILEGISGIARDPRLPPTRFVVVGDHAPPFPLRLRRDQFDMKNVPAILLDPLDSAAPTMKKNLATVER